jgi:hypothetical protein
LCRCIETQEKGQRVVPCNPPQLLRHLDARG